MATAVQTITDRVRARIRADGTDLARDRSRAADYVRDEVRRYSERALGSADPLLDDEQDAAAQVLAALTGFGPLQPLLDDDEVEEIWINSPSRVFAARRGIAELTSVVLHQVQVRDLVERMLQSSGRRVDLSSPFVDASLPDGSRLHVVIPDITRRHWAVNIRKFPRRPLDLAALIASGSLDRQSAEFLRMSVLAGLNILVSGGTQAGKTTLLGALVSTARPSERIVTVEETFEVQVTARDVVALQCRQPNLEGTGEVTLRRLVKEALRMRPDRLVVGEVREAEALDLLIALNSGIPGMATIHANSARDALAKLCTLPLLAGTNVDASFVVPTVADTVDLVVHCQLQRNGGRRIGEILAVNGRSEGAGGIETSVLFAQTGGRLRPTGIRPGRTTKFDASGLDPAHVLGAAS